MAVRFLAYFRLRKVKLLIILAAAFLFFSSLPQILGLKYWHPLYSYKIMWLNFLGARYALPLGTPKPLIVLFAGIVPPSFIYIFASFFSALLVLCLMELSKEITGSYLGGLFASFFYFFCNSDLNSSFLFFAYWPVIYNALLFFFILLFVKKAYSFASIILFLAGLIRPESWFYAPVLLFWLYWSKEKIKLIYFIPLLAPVIWCLFDYKISGDFLLSYHITHKYAAFMATQSYNLLSFFPDMARKILSSYRFPILISGVTAILFEIIYFFRMKGKDRINIHIIIPMAIIPFLLYWLTAVKKVFYFELRFFNFSILVVYFYAAILPFIFFKKRLLSFVFLILLTLFSFQWNDLRTAVVKKKTEEASAKSMKGAADFLKQYLIHHKIDGKIMTSAENMEYLSLRFGQKFSHKILLFREVANNPKLLSGVPGGLTIVTFPNPNPPDTLLFFFLLRSSYKAGYIFKPIFISPDRNSYVLEIVRKGKAKM